MTKSALKLDGEKIYFEKSSDVVKYKNGTLQEAMNNLAFTPYGKKLLQAQNAEELKHLLQVKSSFIFDEAENTQWFINGNPSKTSANAKFNTALTCSPDNFITSQTQITFGGNPFTLSFWARIDSSSPKGSIIFSAGDLQLVIDYNSTFQTNGIYLKYASTSGGNRTTFFDAIHHFEFNFDGARSSHLFVDGRSEFNLAYTIPRTARTVRLGGAIVTFDEFRLLDGVCLHTGTSSFTPPSLPHDLTDQTKILLHFD